MSGEIANLRKLAIEAACGEAERMRAAHAEAELRHAHRISNAMIRALAEVPPETPITTLLSAVAHLAGHVMAAMPPGMDLEPVWMLFVAVGRERAARNRAA